MLWKGLIAVDQAHACGNLNHYLPTCDLVNYPTKIPRLAAVWIGFTSSASYVILVMWMSRLFPI